MTLDSTLEEIQNLVTNNVDVSVGQWIDYAAKLNILLMSLEGELIAAEMAVSRDLSNRLTTDPTLSVSRARAINRGSDEYQRLLELKSKHDRVSEQIRIAKKRTSIEPWQH